jgi:MFS family permease
MRELLFEISSAAAYFAHAIFSYAVIIYAQDLTGTTAESGLLFILLYAPSLLLGLYAGVAADRYPRKRILLASQAAAALVTAAAAAAVLSGRHDRWVLTALLALCPLYGSALAFLPATRIACASNVVDDKALERCTLVLKTLNISSLGAGPFAAGWIKAHADWPVLFAVPVALWVVSNLLLVPLRTQRESRAESEGARSWEELTEGVRLVGGTPLLRALCLVSGIIFFLVSGPYQVLVPNFAREVLHANEVQRGALMGIFGGGLLAGGIASMALGRIRARGQLLLVTLILSVSSFLVFGYQTSYALAVVLLGLCGVLGGVFYSLVPTTLQVITPDRFRGRVLSAYYILMVGGPALGGVASGWLTSTLGVVSTLRLTAFSALVVSGLSMLLLPSLTRYTTDQEVGMPQAPSPATGQ